MITIQGIPESLNKRLEVAKVLKKALDKYIYLNEKIQNEVVHWDTLKLFRKIELEVEEQINLLKEEFEK
jgi:hypothetical protein